MPEANQVTLRLLADEIAWSAAAGACDGAEIELDSPPAAIDLQPGALVEIESLDTLSLGQVVWREGTRVLVVVEHTVDLHKLAKTQEVWHAPKA